MAIRFKYDAAAVSIPADKSQQRFGQQLVAQQQKYANDQRQTQQSMVYDQQRQFQQNAFRLQAAQTDRFFEDQRIKDQQAFAGKMQQNTLDARQLEAKQRMEVAAQQEEKQRLAQLKAQQRADDFDAMKSGGYDPVTAMKLRDTYRAETDIDLQAQRGELDAAMTAEAHAKNLAARSELQKARVQTPSITDKLNEGVQWKDPATGFYYNPNDREKFPDGKKPEGWDSVDLNESGKGSGSRSAKPQQQLPPVYEDYADMDNDKSIKELRAKKAELQDRSLDGGTKYDTDQELEDAAYAELKGEYERQRGRISSGKSKSAASPILSGQPMTAAPGQAMMDPAAAFTAPAEQPTGMQGLEPTYNSDGTSNAPLNGAGAGLPPQAGQTIAPPEDPAAVEAARMAGMQARFDAAPGQALGTPVPANVPTPGNPVTFMDASGRQVERKAFGIDGSVYQRTGNAVLNADGSSSLRGGQKEYGEWKQIWLDGAGNEVPQPARDVAAATATAADAQATPQNAWSEFVVPETQAPVVAPSAAVPIADVTSPATAVEAPDFNILMSKAADDADRSVLGRLQGIYKSQSPEIQNAISVLVNPDTSPQEIARILDYLKASGVDLEKMPQAGTGTERLKKYQKNSTTTMR